MAVGKRAFFERLRAAIQHAEAHGTIIKWNNCIDGRQFDATLRIRRGPFEYLVVVDCIESQLPVTVEVVEAFAAKSKAIAARLAILISLSGYTQDAMAVAIQNDIKLLTQDTVQKLSAEELSEQFSPVINIRTFRFLRAGGIGEIAIPEEPEILKFFMREVKIEGPDFQTFPERIVDEQYERLARTATRSSQVLRVLFSQGTTIRHPNTGHKINVTAFTFTYQLLSACDLTMREGLGSDPYLLGSMLRDELGKRNRSADASRIDSDFDTTPKAGKYYYNPRLRFSYYCEAVRRLQARIVLVESYQSGQLVQARTEIPISLFRKLVEVTEPGEINRLTQMYEAFAVSDKNLEERFKVFAKGLDGAECIDELVLTPEQKRASKADYFFCNRKVIAEFKTLKTDTSPKIERILTPYKEGPEWPLFYGRQALQKILSYLPDKEKINAQITSDVTDSIEGIVEKANRQIRGTKQTFNQPDSGGLLIIFNDIVDIFSPELVAYRARKSLTKRTADGKIRFPHVSVVLVINGAHYAQITPALKGIPILIIPNNISGTEKVEEFVTNLVKKWSAFNKMPLINIDVEKVTDLEFKRFSYHSKERTGPLTVIDLWRYEYRKRPYLRSYGNEDLFRHGSRVSEELLPCFMKGAPKIPQEKRDRLIARWTHFLEEINFRGINMKEWTPWLNGLKERWNELPPR